MLAAVASLPGEQLHLHRAPDFQAAVHYTTSYRTTPMRASLPQTTRFRTLSNRRRAGLDSPQLNSSWKVNGPLIADACRRATADGSGPCRQAISGSLQLRKSDSALGERCQRPPPLQMRYVSPIN